MVHALTVRVKGDGLGSDGTIDAIRFPFLSLATCLPLARHVHERLPFPQHQVDQYFKRQQSHFSSDFLIVLPPCATEDLIHHDHAEIFSGAHGLHY